MARIRSIKPEFWTSEQLAECSPNARLLFIGIWTFSDDSGIHPASTKRLKMEVFPGDPFTDSQVFEMVKELISADLLKVYEVGGEGYWRVTGWKHQKIDQPTYRHPLPDGKVPSTPFRRRIDGERSPNTSGGNGARSPLESSRVDMDMDVESNGVDGQVHEIASMHPKIHDAFHLPYDIALAIAEAIARDGRDIVWAGTKCMAEGVAKWPKEELRFLVKPQTFYRESHYRRAPEEWEPVSKKPASERVMEEFKRKHEVAQ